MYESTGRWATGIRATTGEPAPRWSTIPHFSGSTNFWRWTTLDVYMWSFTAIQNARVMVPTGPGVWAMISGGWGTPEKGSRAPWSLIIPPGGGAFASDTPAVGIPNRARGHGGPWVIGCRHTG